MPREWRPPSGHTSPVDAPRAHEPAAGAPEQPPRSEANDAGRTGGGGSLGHLQPERVEREGPASNNAVHRTTDEPTLPSDDVTLNTKI